jgi:hypothetical protein
MGTLGEHLRGIRESRGASLDDIARAPRVGKRHLEALETEALADLPAPVFVKGFIRAYCSFLQAAPDGALERYRELLADDGPAQGGTARRPDAPPWSRGPVLTSFVLLVLLLGALLAVNAGLRGAPGPVVPTAPPLHPPGAERTGDVPAVAPAPTPVAAPGARPGAAVASPQLLVVRAVEPTWIRVQMDLRDPVQELLPVGATREWRAEQRFVLTVGNAGGLELMLNGRALPPLGARGAVIRELVLPQGAASPSP